MEWVWPAVFSAGVSWGVAWWVCRHAEALRLVRLPDHRSSHVRPTPNGGGMGLVLAGSLAGAGLMLQSGRALGWVVLGLALLLAAVGLRDDIRSLSAGFRISMQLTVTAAFLAVLGEMPHLVLPFGPVLQGWMQLGLLLLVGLWWINLFNFIDGIDGIAGAQAVYMLVAGALIAAWWRPEAAADPFWAWMLCLAAAAAGFLLLNWPPAKIFMGDVGSTYLGFMIFCVTLVTVQARWLSYKAWLILGALFLADATVTLLTRMLRGDRWYEAHCSHAYQRLARRWQSHRPVTMLAIALNALWLAPLAWASLIWEAWGWGFVALAYAPLVAGAVMLRAGRPDGA